MRRDIRFRGKRLDNGEWVYGDLFQSKYITSILVNRDDRDLDPGWFYPNDVFECHKVDPETVGQYTGLKDRNGKEIYEMDIFPPGERTHGEITIVCYDTKQARYKSVPLSLYKANAGNGGWTGYDINPYSEVIGSVYDNPDLLEG